jgi:lysophospholipase L1-like esterase
MFKTRSRDRFMFATRRPKRQHKFSLLWFLVFVSLILVVLELSTRILFDISGNNRETIEGETLTEKASAYRLKFVNESQQPEQIATDGNLIAQRSVSVGYQLIGSQTNEYWQINEQGFRDRDPLPLAKPNNEIRIFLLGGSTAFGYGNSSNEATISEQLETRLKQRVAQQKSSPQMYRGEAIPTEAEQRKLALTKPPKIKQGEYRVINAAVPGYASGNELAQLALQVLRYKPDLIIVLNGYPDLMLSGDKKAAEIPQIEQYLESDPTNFRSYLNQLLQPLRNKSYLVTTVQDWLLVPDNDKNSLLLDEAPDKLAQYLPQTEEEFKLRLGRYLQNQKQMASLSAGARVPLIIAVQPEITGRDPSLLTPTEGTITSQLGREYILGVKENYGQLVAATQQLSKIFPYNVTTINLYNLNNNYPSPSFIDAIHLTDEANKMVAEQLYYAIASLPKMQVTPNINWPSLPPENQSPEEIKSNSLLEVSVPLSTPQ